MSSTTSRRHRRTAERVLPGLAVVVTTALGVAASLFAAMTNAAGPPPGGQPGGMITTLARPAHDVPGAADYAFFCSTCHGPTGHGLPESRATFPQDHRSCERCHNPRNPARMGWSDAANDLAVFSLGDPPPLADPGYLGKYGNAAALAAYVGSAMPRWNPGRLTPEQAHDVTLYLLFLSGSLPEDAKELYLDGRVAAIDLAGIELPPTR